MITALIISGAVLMIWNIYRICRFIRSTQDVLSSKSDRDKRWMLIALILLFFFLGAYLFVGIFADPNLVPEGGRDPPRVQDHRYRRHLLRDHDAPVL